MTWTKRGVFLVVFVFLTLLLFSSLAVASCLIYPGSDDRLYCVDYDAEAQTLCNSPRYAGCNEQTHVVPQNCNQLAICEPVECNSLVNGCEANVARGFCEYTQGDIVPPDQHNDWCSPGCCKVSSPSTALFCQYNLNQYQCEQKSIQRTGSADNDVFFGGTTMNAQRCAEEICAVTLSSGTLSGVVRAENGNFVSDAVIRVASVEGRTDSGGQYLFSSLNPGTYRVEVSASGFITKIVTATINSGEEVSLNFVLLPVGGIYVRGVVTDEQGTSLNRVLVSWSGPSTGQTMSESNGNYAISGLLSGTYTLAFSKAGYLPHEYSTPVGDTVTEYNVQLRSAQFQGVKGKTLIEENRNAPRQPINGVSLYVDGVFRGYSQLNGDFEIYVDSATAGQRHTLAARYQGYTSEEFVFPLDPGRSVTHDLVLFRYQGICSDEATFRSPDNVVAFPVPGQKKIQLQWSKPCPEVLGYELQRFRTGNPVPEQEFTLPLTATSYIDGESLEWGTSYSYNLIAHYDRGGVSEVVTLGPVNPGDARCENKFNDPAWGRFCILDDLSTSVDERKQIFTCLNDNTLALSEGCASSGIAHYCAAISETQAVCRDGGVCGIQSSSEGAGSQMDTQDADPFGLYYSKERCYGSNDPSTTTTFCYFDYTPTSVNQCRSCVSIENCFGYKSKSACEANTCLSSSCQWVNSAQHDALIDYGLLVPELQIPGTVTAETGAGYCVEKEYGKDDFCSLCGSNLQPISESGSVSREGSSLFENYFCTPDVCSALGRCFSDPYGLQGGKKLSSCLKCGDKPSPGATCSHYATQLECTGGSTVANKGISKNGWGEITLSNDQCSWGRCAWVSDASGSGHCIKDGDVDDVDDCLSFSNDAERLACRLDIFPPQTTLIAETIPVVSTATPSLLFDGQDQESPLAALGYCLVKAGSSSPCPEFSYSSYRGTLPQDSITVNLLESRALPLDIAGETYRLLYFSKDKYSNQENVHESFIFVDTVLPQFQINSINQTIGDRTKLTLFLDGMNEPMACTFTLLRVLPRGDAVVRTIAREELQKRVVFEQLEGIGFDLTVQCTDDHGNIAMQEKKYTFNLEENVNVVYPPLGGIVSSTSIAFEVETLANSRCSLYSATNVKLADFEIIDGIGKKHKTVPLPGFYEKEYAREHKVVCEELLTNKVYEDVYLHFTIDTTPPLAQVVLREEGSNEQRPTEEGWRLSFVEQAHVSFECASNQGFSCTSYLYCLGEQCNHARTIPFRAYSQPFSVRETTKLCYYAEDEAQNPLPQIICGRIVVDGYGITLESPNPFYYGSQVWGVSSVPQFDWRFFTRISTEQCAFDFDQQFDYSRTPPFRLLSPNGNHYLYSDFPLRTGASSYPETGGYKQVTLLCKSGEKISPPQSFFLEYDPSPPTIERVEVHPSPVIEGGEVTLTVTTDDKTTCRFDDSSQEFSTMRFGFPDREDKQLNTTHRTDYFFSLAGERGEITLNAQCQNGAGLLSDVEQVTFTIDYTLPGAILSVFPQGDFFNTNTITARVETNRAASCTYRNENGTFLRFEGDGGFIHTANFVNLQEKRYQYLVQCSMEGHTVEQEISFTIDRTAPVITGISDGNQTCGSPVVLILPYTEEENVSAYYYELYDLGRDRNKASSRGSSSSEIGSSGSNETRSGSVSNSSSNMSTELLTGGITSTTRVLSSSSRQQVLVVNSTMVGKGNINLSTTELQVDHRYVVKVKVQDKAGNFGEFAESDGFIVTPRNLSSCQDTTAPRVDFVTNTSLCSSVGVELHCDDAVGCRTLRYGVEESSALCSVTQEYNGAKIQLAASSWICYSVADQVGNNYTNKERIPVVDADGDGILDHCDACSNTPAGKAVGGEGCAAGEVPEEERSVDTDKDSLPDFWERSYNDIGCEFDERRADTDGDGINDALDDYDADLFTNYEEYVEGLNPCVADPRADAGESQPRRNETTGPDVIPRPPLQESNILAIVLLILGLLLFVFSIVYFWYDYSQSRKAGALRFKSTQKSTDNADNTVASSIRRGATQPSSLKPISLEKVREDIAERQQRRSVFSAFEDSDLGKIDSLLQKKTTPAQKADAIIQHYSDHKETIDKTLGRQERSIFAKLQDITKEKGASAGSSAEREILFKKLRSIIDKKKGE